MQLEEVLKAYDFYDPDNSIVPFGNGLINHTWKISAAKSGQEFILQRINTAVFQRPEDIAWNIRKIDNYLKRNFPEYLFIAPVKTVDQMEMYVSGEKDYFRVFPFLKRSHTFDVVSTKTLAYEAAGQFARFTKLLCGLDPSSLKTTLPDFHNLPLRYEQFLSAIENGNENRIKKGEGIIEQLVKHQPIVETFNHLKTHADFKIRVTHHDTKISNVLFDEHDKGLCVIDLDTVMPGYFISDLGDMMRTYLSPVSEEENDVSKIEVRPDYFLAIVAGYLSEMEKELTETEKQQFVYAGKFMIYMQALRFLTDYLNNDRYYGSRYEGHNLVRATNQAILLQKLVEKEDFLLSNINSLSINHL